MHREVILNTLQTKTPSKGIKLPKNIDFNMTDSVISLRLSNAAIGLTDTPLNMQQDNACFEGWAVAIYKAFGETKKLCLDVSLDSLPKTVAGKHCHYNRFLYRAMKFYEQYPWFMLSDKLICAVKEFKQFIDNNTFVNNIAGSVTGENTHLESLVENSFVQRNTDYLKTLCESKGYPFESKLYSQLPVGLFLGKKTEKNRFFTGKKSAIDLWNITGDAINIFELKSKNKMVGAVTEMFFYSNYIFDFFIRNSFSPSEASCIPINELRGYNELIASQLKKINVFLLAENDSIHPLLTPEIFELLSAGGLYGKINYDFIYYDMDRVLLNT